LFCILGCFIGLLDWLVQFFNEYAFSYIALYGKAYIPAAKVCPEPSSSPSSLNLQHVFPSFKTRLTHSPSLPGT
jgi:hypothetical protein